VKCSFINVTISEPNITFTTLKSQFSHGLAIRDHIMRVDLGICWAKTSSLRLNVVGACRGGLFDHLPHLLKQNRFNIEFQQFCIIQIQQFKFALDQFTWYIAYKYCMMGRAVMVLYLHLCIESKSNTKV
jgi:hypothetical protein